MICMEVLKGENKQLNNQNHKINPILKLKGFQHNNDV